MSSWPRNKKVRSQFRRKVRSQKRSWYLERQEEMRVAARIQAAKRDQTTGST